MAAHPPGALVWRWPAALLGFLAALPAVVVILTATDRLRLPWIAGSGWALPRPSPPSGSP